MKRVERIEFVIECSEANKETEKFLEGIQQIGKEIFYAVDSTYPDLVDIPECYRNALESIRESFVEGELDDAIDLLYLIVSLCDDSAKIKMEAFACMSEETKDAILEGFVSTSDMVYGIYGFEGDDECGEWENHCYL